MDSAEQRQRRFEELSKERQSIVFSNCSIKKERSGDGLQLIVGDNIVIPQSNKWFALDFSNAEQVVDTTDTTKEIFLNQLNDQPPFQKVIVNIKVIEIGDTFVVDDHCQDQNLVIADSTGKTLSLAKPCWIFHLTQII